MTTRRIAPGKALGYSDFYIDFLMGRSPAATFIPTADLKEVAGSIDRHSFNRRELVEILQRQNSTFLSDAAALESIQLLSQENTLCVFAGQQAGLFTGPMLVIVKALAVVKLARAYSEELARPVIPIFWIAGDDHDFDEIASTWILNQQSELVELRYEGRPSAELPAAEIRFDHDEELDRLKALFRASLGQTDFTDDLFGAIDSAYATGETFVSAFGKLLARLTANTGLVLFNPCDADVKSLAAPFFDRVIDALPRLHQALSETNAALVSSGYHLQVEKKQDAALLFRNLDGRRPVHIGPGGFSIGSDHLTTEQLREEIRNHPERFSPDVMTRPVMQSVLFPTLCQIGGPAEIAYLAQCRRFFDILDVPCPIHRGRPSVTFLEKRIEKLVDDYQVSFEELSGDIEQVVNRVLAETFPRDLEQGYSELTADLTERWRRFADSSLAFDPSLEEFARQTFGKIDFTLKGFEAKLFSAHKKKGKDIRERIYRIQHHLFPRRSLQERTLNIGCYLARHGFSVVPYLLDQMEADQTAHQIIALSEMPQS